MRWVQGFNLIFTRAHSGGPPHVPFNHRRRGQTYCFAVRKEKIKKLVIIYNFKSHFVDSISAMYCTGFITPTISKQQSCCLPVDQNKHTFVLTPVILTVIVHIYSSFFSFTFINHGQVFFLTSSSMTLNMCTVMHLDIFAAQAMAVPELQ